MTHADTVATHVDPFLEQRRDVRYRGITWWVRDDQAIDKCIIAGHDWEPPTTRAFWEHATRPDARDILDVGANIGWYTLLAMSAAAQNNGSRPHWAQQRVTCVEGSTVCAEVLSHNIRANLAALHGCIHMENALVVGSTFAATTYCMSVMHDNPYLGGKRDGMTDRTVPRKTVDQIVYETCIAPSLIKIDVDGLEDAVLEGATNTLRSFRPTLIMEIGEVTMRNAYMLKRAAAVAADPDAEVPAYAPGGCVRSLLQFLQDQCGPFSLESLNGGATPESRAVSWEQLVALLQTTPTTDVCITFPKL